LSEEFPTELVNGSPGVLVRV